MASVTRKQFQDAIEKGIESDSSGFLPCLDGDQRDALRDLAQKATEVGQSFRLGCGCPLAQIGRVDTALADVDSIKAWGEYMAQINATASFWLIYDAAMNTSMGEARFDKNVNIQIVEG